MTHKEKMKHLGRAVEHLEKCAAIAQLHTIDEFSRHLYDAVRSIGAIVEELVKEQGTP